MEVRSGHGRRRQGARRAGREAGGAREHRLRDDVRRRPAAAPCATLRRRPRAHRRPTYPSVGIDRPWPACGARRRRARARSSGPLGHHRARLRPVGPRDGHLHARRRCGSKARLARAATARRGTRWRSAVVHDGRDRLRCRRHGDHLASWAVAIDAVEDAASPTCRRGLANAPWTDEVGDRRLLFRRTLAKAATPPGPSPEVARNLVRELGATVTGPLGRPAAPARRGHTAAGRDRLRRALRGVRSWSSSGGADGPDDRRVFDWSTTQLSTSRLTNDGPSGP